MIPVILFNINLTLAIEQVCELEADLTAIPPREFVRKRASDGTLYYKLLYSIGMTFRNTIAFELIFNGRAYETIFAKYACMKGSLELDRVGRENCVCVNGVLQFCLTYLIPKHR